jgi:hypothetical protein
MIISAVLLAETDAAIKIRVDGDSYWLPKSQIDYTEDCTVGEEIDIELPEWLAEEKGL